MEGYKERPGRHERDLFSVSGLPAHAIQPSERDLGHLNEPKGVEVEDTSTPELLKEGEYEGQVGAKKYNF